MTTVNREHEMARAAGHHAQSIFNEIKQLRAVHERTSYREMIFLALM